MAINTAIFRTSTATDASDDAAPLVFGQPYSERQSAIVDIPATGTFADVNGVVATNSTQVIVRRPVGSGTGAIAATDPITPAEFSNLDVVEGVGSAPELWETPTTQAINKQGLYCHEPVPSAQWWATGQDLAAGVGVYHYLTDDIDGEIRLYTTTGTIAAVANNVEPRSSANFTASEDERTGPFALATMASNVGQTMILWAKDYGVRWDTTDDFIHADTAGTIDKIVQLPKGEVIQFAVEQDGATTRLREIPVANASRGLPSVFVGETALVPASAGEPTNPEVRAFAALDQNNRWSSMLWYTGTDSDTDTLKYFWFVDNKGIVFGPNVPDITNPLIWPAGTQITEPGRYSFTMPPDHTDPALRGRTYLIETSTATMPFLARNISASQAELDAAIAANEITEPAALPPSGIDVEWLDAAQTSFIKGTNPIRTGARKLLIVSVDGDLNIVNWNDNEVAIIAADGSLSDMGATGTGYTAFPVLKGQRWEVTTQVIGGVEKLLFTEVVGVTAKNALVYPTGNFTALPVNDSGSGEDGAVYKLPAVDALQITLPNKADMDLANGIWRVRISGEWTELSAQATPLSFTDDTANGVELGSGLPDSANEWIDLVFDDAGDRWIATSGGDVTVSQVIPTYSLHTEVPTAVRLYLIDGTSSSAEGLYRKETVGNAPNYIG